MALFNVDGTYYAIDELCTHEEAPLWEGAVDGTIVTCPWHASMFDLTNGVCLSPPATEDVRTHDVRVEGDQILVAVE